MKSQFARIESYGLVVSKQAKTKKNKTTIKGVCGEAIRMEGFTEHIDDVGPADIIYGISPMELFSKIELQFHAKNKALKTDGLRVRQKDALLMSAGVFSYPGTADDDFLAWQTDCVEYLKSEYGDRFISAVIHLDEAYPHIHFFLCDFRTLTVDNGLDPAKTDQRKSRVVKDGSAIGQEKALEAFQDRFYNAVGVRYGHVRKIGARARIHGSPKWVKSILKEMKLNTAEKEHLLAMKGVISDEAVKLKATELRLLEMETSFSAGIKRLDAFLAEQVLKYEALVTAGQIEAAKLILKSIEATTKEFDFNPAIRQALLSKAKTGEVTHRSLGKH